MNLFHNTEKTKWMVLVALFWALCGPLQAQRLSDAMREAGSTSELAAAAAPFVQLAHYGYETDSEDLANLPPGFDSTHQRDDWNGLDARSFKNDHTKEIVVAFGGTRGTRDIVADLQLGRGGIPRQFAQADQHVAQLQRQFPGYRIVTTGHSLGGALAIYTGRRNGLDAIGFNAPNLNTLLNAQPPRASSRSPEAIRHIVFESMEPDQRFMVRDEHGNLRFTGDLVSALTREMPDEALAEVVNDLWTYLEEEGSWLVRRLLPNDVTTPEERLAWLRRRGFTTAFSADGVERVPLETRCLDTFCHSLNNFDDLVNKLKPTDTELVALPPPTHPSLSPEAGSQRPDSARERTLRALR